MKGLLCLICYLEHISISDTFRHGRVNSYIRYTTSNRIFGQSSYEDSTSLVKAVVGGLTQIANLFNGGNSNQVPETAYLGNDIAPTELLNGIIGDFERGYLFSGKIDFDLYHQSCSFTDPTISFTGLATFENNIKSIQPLIDALITDALVVLYSASLDDEKKMIMACWSALVALTSSGQLFVK